MSELYRPQDGLQHIFSGSSDESSDASSQPEDEDALADALLPDAPAYVEDPDFVDRSPIRTKALTGVSRTRRRVRKRALSPGKRLGCAEITGKNATIRANTTQVGGVQANPHKVFFLEKIERIRGLVYKFLFYLRNLDVDATVSLLRDDFEQSMKVADAGHGLMGAGALVDRLDLRHLVLLKEKKLIQSLRLIPDRAALARRLWGAGGVTDASASAALVEDTEDPLSMDSTALSDALVTELRRFLLEDAMNVTVYRLGEDNPLREAYLESRDENGSIRIFPKGFQMFPYYVLHPTAYTVSWERCVYILLEKYGEAFGRSAIDMF